MSLTQFSFLLGACLASVVNSPTMAQSNLQKTLNSAIAGDRTGACVQVALINQTVTTASACATPQSRETRPLDFDTAFEIGSISKVMTSVVLAGLMRDEKLSLDTPLATILPEDVRVPEYRGTEIRLRHLITHSSGLPAIPDVMNNADPLDPYSKLTAADLYRALERVELESRPGSHFAYSNFAMLLLSAGLSQFSGQPFEALLRQYLLTPLALDNTFTGQSPDGVNVAQGHSQTGHAVPAWNFGDSLHGAGGIKSSLNDMIRFVQANLDNSDTETNVLLKKTHAKVGVFSGQEMGMNWVRTKLNGSNILMHEGGTSGFSSLVAFSPKGKRGIVILSDTALTALGGLSSLAFSLLDSNIPLPEPRTKQTAPHELLASLAGEYRLEDVGLDMRLWHDNGELYVQAPGQPKFVLGYDSHGDFFTRDIDARLRPVPSADGPTFDWFQNGGTLRAIRLDPKPHTEVKPSSSQLADYVGNYPLFNGFTLTVTRKKNTLWIRGTGQPALSVEPVAIDQFTRDDVGALFVFNRDESGQVVSLTLKQHGQSLTGSKQ